MKSLNFMIVDDSTILVKNLTYMLEQLGHTVVGSAKTGSEAVNNFEKYKPDIITMDITMKDMNGIEATEKILEKDKDAVIIMITALGQEQIIVNCISKGAKSYLTKPIDPIKLKNTIEKIYATYFTQDK